MVDDSAALIRAELDKYTINHEIEALYTTRAPDWVSSQGYRGTSNILWSCALTMTVCIYTVLHLNVSSDSDGKAGPVQRFKLKWVAAALFAPELVLYLACFQFFQARYLMKELNVLQKTSKKSRKDFVFDMRYAFFIVMGGLHVSYKDIVTDWAVFEGAPKDKPIPPRSSLKSLTANGQAQDELDYNMWTEGVELWEDDHRREWKTRPYTFDSFNSTRPTRALSSKGVIDLARKEKFIYISRETIEDKSKQSTIQKVLVVTQIVWMVTQCFARKAYGLPLALVEVHTMVHVACAVLLYLLWFKKPLDVRTPEMLDLFITKEIQALLLYESIVEDSPYLTVLCPVVSGTCPLLQSLNNDGTIDLKRNADGAVIFRATINPDERLQREAKFILNPGETIPCGVRFLHRNKATVGAVCLSSQDCALLARVVAAVEQIDGGPISHPQIFSNRISTRRSPDKIAKSWYQNLLGDLHNEASSSPFQSQSNLDYIQLLSRGGFTKILLICLPAIYGGVHLSAWYTMFSTPFESLLWKCAAFVIIGGYPVYLVIAHAYAIMLERQRKDHFIFDSFVALVHYIVILAYIGSRIYIVVESFISLRAVPIGVYWTPSWTEMLPHA